MIKWLRRLLTLTILLFSTLLVWMWVDYQGFLKQPISISSAQQSFEISPGENTSVIIRHLKQQGIIANETYLRFYVKTSGVGKDIKAGEYLLTKDMTVVTLLNLVVTGTTQKYSLTIPEGWSFKQLMQALEKELMINKVLTGLSNAEIMTRLGYPGRHPEGWFFPDTYHFSKGISDLQFLQRAANRMQSVLDEAWENRSKNLPLKNAYEALTLASIIEKETGAAAERRTISGVFIRRLNKKMKLQTDPTVIYGMGDRYKGNIRRKDLREDTPYNTYVHKGLTPTPISLPGKAAIEAAVNPADGNSLYFVGKGDGTHQFSATLKAHNKAVKKYQLGQ